MSVSKWRNSIKLASVVSLEKQRKEYAAVYAGRPVPMLNDLALRRYAMPPTVTREQAEAALQAAFSVLGAPYVWGGQDPSGFDCSGLAIWAYNHAVPGIHWYTGDSFVDDTTAHMLFVYNVKPLRAREVWPGDLVFVTSSTNRVTHMGCSPVGWMIDALRLNG